MDVIITIYPMTFDTDTQEWRGSSFSEETELYDIIVVDQEIEDYDNSLEEIDAIQPHHLESEIAKLEKKYSLDGAVYIDYSLMETMIAGNDYAELAEEDYEEEQE